MELLFPLLIVFMIGMIFLSNRQRKKQQQQQESLQNSLHVGDIVVMTSGVSGTIVDVDDERTIDLEIAPDVVTTWLRAAVREKIGGEDTPAPDADGSLPGTAGVTAGEALDDTRTAPADGDTIVAPAGDTNPAPSSAATTAESDGASVAGPSRASSGLSDPTTPRSSN